MKKIYKKIIFILAGFLVLGSCDSFLEEEPRDFLGTGNFYSNVREAESAVIGVYELLNERVWGGRDRIVLGDSPAPIVGRDLNYAVIRDLWNFRWNASLGLFRQLWQTLFEAVNRANDAIDNIPNISGIVPEVSNRLTGEARFLRSLAYFELVRAFGDIPLRKTAFTGAEISDPILERAPVDSVYAFIFQDLKQAQDELTNAGQMTTRDRASVGAVTTLLGKAYLTYAGLLKYQRMLDDIANEYYKKAEDELVKVMNMDYELFLNYAKVFYPAYENGVEHIFSVQYTNDDPRLDSELEWSLGPRLRGTKFKYVQIKPHNSFRNSIPEHFRKRFVIADSVQLEDGTYTDQYFANWRRYHFGKYYAPAYWKDDTRRTNHNLPILRYADVLLMAAEARSARLGKPDQQAIDWFNEVRDRATTAYVTNRGLDNLTDDIDQSATDFSKANLPLIDLSQFNDHEDFVDVLANERMWEFAGEGHARWDLIRLGRYLEMNDKARERHLLFPIPTDEMEIHLDVWRQNPGY